MVLYQPLLSTSWPPVNPMHTCIMQSSTDYICTWPRTQRAAELASWLDFSPSSSLQTCLVSTGPLADPGHQLCSALPARVLYPSLERSPLPCFYLQLNNDLLLLPDSEKEQPAPTITSFLMQDKSCLNINAFSLLSPSQLQFLFCSNFTSHPLKAVHIWDQLTTFTNTVLTKSHGPFLALPNRTFTCGIKWLQSPE